MTDEKKTDYLRMKVELNRVIEKDLWEIDYLYAQMIQENEALSNSVTELKIENAELKQKVEQLQLLLDIQNYLIEPEHKDEKKKLQSDGWVDVSMPCTKDDARDCITKQEGLCESEDGKCHIRINLSKLCKC